MNENYGRDLDLNLLRVFGVVAECGGVTEAAKRLYLTQPAVSAALRRLTLAVGAPLTVRQGRRLALTNRGARLFAEASKHLRALVDAALAPAEFDPRTSERTLRLGLSDAMEVWLLPRLLGALEREAPSLRLIAVSVQFRNVSEALSSGRAELAVTVADDLPAGMRRERLFTGDFVCLFDSRRQRLPARLTEKAYFARDHVVVSYNADLRGIVEDMLHKTRRTRCSVSSFSNIGAIVDGSALVATVPRLVARQIRAVRPHLRTAELPFSLAGAWTELVWPAAADDDGPSRLVREHIVRIARDATRHGTRPTTRRRATTG